MLRRAPAGEVGAPVVMAGAVGVLAVARFVAAAHRDVTRWVLAERPFADPAAVPHGLHVLAKNGYDGQFYYRLALDPANLHRTAHGITLDSAERLGRIGYPALVWLVSGGGRPGLVPWMMIVVNALALVAVARAGALLAAGSGRSPWWGLALSGFCGFEFSYARDLCEPLTAALALGGLVALRAERWVAASLLLAGATLCRETAFVYVGGWMAWRAWEVARRRSRPGAPDLAWAVPTAAFSGWELTVRQVTGTLPLTAASGSNIGFPFRGPASGVHFLLTHHSGAYLLEVAHLAVLAVVVALAAASLTMAGGRPPERLIWGVALILAVCSGPLVWDGDVDLRGFTDLWLTSVIVLLGNRGRMRSLVTVGVLGAGAWLVGAARWTARL